MIVVGLSGNVIDIKYKKRQRSNLYALGEADNLMPEEDRRLSVQPTDFTLRR